MISAIIKVLSFLPSLLKLNELFSKKPKLLPEVKVKLKEYTLDLEGVLIEESDELRNRMISSLSRKLNKLKKK